MTGKKVIVGLSGGVDSSVAAALLLEQGYEVSGVYLECYNEPGCRTDQDKADALKVAIKLGIPFQVLDFRREYKEKVIEYFYCEYEAGRTPNPDVMCNREVKFGIFYDWAMTEGYEYVATGHYARIVKNKDPFFVDIGYLQRTDLCFSLQMAMDESKDQSYFLWQIPQDHLAHILFPLGEMLKTEVRAKAKELGLLTANKPDSMGICFIGDVNVNNLLQKRLGENPGEVIMKITNNQSPTTKQPKNKHLNKNSKDFDYLEDDYAVVGRHSGLWFYTIGERGGWEMGKLNHKTIESLHQMGIDINNLPPLYVIGKNKEKNQLVVGKREETMKSEFRISNIEYRISKQEKLWVRIRNLGELTEVESLSSLSSGKCAVELKQKIFGVAEGQSAVFYDKNKVLVGGSIIV